MESKEIFVNGRFLTQSPTGVQKFALGICRELHHQGYQINFLTPPNVSYPPGFGKVIKLGSFSGHLWEQIELPSYVNKNKIT